jgi:hypothetical protein
MLEKTLELQFKGGRDYLHGTDMFNATLDWLTETLGEIRDIDFTFHRLARQQLQAVAGVAAEGVKPVAVCGYTAKGIRERIHLVETEQSVTGRYPYPEDEVVATMEIDPAARCGVLRGETHYSDIEVWIAMTKVLHYQVFPQLRGKWLFVRGRFPHYEHRSQATERRLTLAACFNDKLTRSEALLDGIKVGEIYFSIV